MICKKKWNCYFNNCDFTNFAFKEKIRCDFWNQFLINIFVLSKEEFIKVLKQ